MDEVNIPNDIDDRLVIIFEKEEFMAGLVGFIAGTMMYNLFLGLPMAWFAFRFMQRQKARQPRGAIRHWLYWMGISSMKRYRLSNGLDREVFGQ